ncbi:MAG TPA: HAMP domain-containing protein [Tissierellia bacterium]|nr:HAMP domain-containing protein [Tissierellia bacterium]
MIKRLKVRLNDDRKQHLSLTLLFSLIVILIFLSVILLVGFSLFFLIRVGVLSGFETGAIPASSLIFIFMIASIVIGSVITLILSRYLMHPINRLLNIMARLASGDFTARIKLPKPWQNHSALKDLSESFNTMAQELQNTELLRNEFINNFSHEFKTPIVSIAGFTKLLRQEELTQKQTEYVHIIEEESLRLSQMATNVLNLTKVESQSILTDITTFNLSEQLRGCILLLSSRWEKKDIDFSLDFPEYTITGNEDLLKHVWLNLIDNAIKFSPEESTIEVRIDESAGSTVVSVINPGDAIQPEHRSKIFNKFYQADESHATQGNGVGLAVVKKVVELHRGEVSVESSDERTRFDVRLPKDR